VGRSINPASLVDLDEDALQDYFHRMNGVMGVGSAERATAAGAADAQAESRQHVSEYRRKKSARRSGNYVGLSGFVDNAKLITGPVRPDGTKGPDSLKILLRQWDDKSKNILLELNGREAQRTLNGINVLRQQGVPLSVSTGNLHQGQDVVIPAAEGAEQRKAPRPRRSSCPVIKSIGHIDIGKGRMPAAARRLTMAGWQNSGHAVSLDAGVPGSSAVCAGAAQGGVRGAWLSAIDSDCMARSNKRAHL
jgi:hypothetical protein